MMKKIKGRKGDGGKNIAPPDSDTRTPSLEHPVFCLRYMQQEHDLKDCETDQQIQLIQQLRALSQLTWNQIRASHRHGLGAEKIDRNCLKKPLPKEPVITDDIVFLAFRFAGKAPMVGYRTGPVFRILWLDHSFTLYDH